MQAINQSLLASALVSRCQLSAERAQQATQVVVEALLLALPSHLWRLFGGLRPPPSQASAVNTAPDLIADVAGGLGVNPGVALELIDVVCSTLADAWSDEDLNRVRDEAPKAARALGCRLTRRLCGEEPLECRLPANVRAALPTDLARLFSRTSSAAPAEAPPSARPRRTLSAGAPGFAHPVSSSPLSDGEHSLAVGQPKPPSR